MRNEAKKKIKKFHFKYEISTRFRDLDAFKHINNATFLTYFEDARRVFFSRWDINMHDRSLIVASIKIDYLKQLTHPSELIVGQKISRIGDRSFDILSVLFHGDIQVCSAITTIVCYNFLEKKSISVYKEIKQDYNL